MRTAADYLDCLRNGGCTASEVAQKLGVTQAAASQQFKRLTTKGLVANRDGEFSLTEQGKGALPPSEDAAAAPLLRRIVREEIERFGVPITELDDSDDDSPADDATAVAAAELLGLELAISGIGLSWLRKRRDDLAARVEQEVVESINHLVLLEQAFVAETGRFFGPDKERLEQLWAEAEKRRSVVGLASVFPDEDEPDAESSEDADNGGEVAAEVESEQSADHGGVFRLR